MKLLKKIESTEEGGNTTFELWRPQESSLSEYIEFIHRFLPPGGILADVLSGTGVSALAGLRLNIKKMVMNDSDAPLMTAAMYRMAYYNKWLGQTYGTMKPGSKPPKDDGIYPYSFVPFDDLRRMKTYLHISLPTKNVPLRLSNPTQEQRDALCKANGLLIAQSGIEGAGLGLFTIVDRAIGDALGPYYGKYGFTAPERGTRTVRLASATNLANQGEKDVDVYMKGDPNCPATFMNDPNWTDEVTTRKKKRKRKGGAEADVGYNAELIERDGLPLSHHNYLQAVCTREIKATPQSPVELLLPYCLTDVAHMRARAKKRKLAEDDDEGDSDGEVNELIGRADLVSNGEGADGETFDAISREKAAKSRGERAAKRAMNRDGGKEDEGVEGDVDIDGMDDDPEEC